MTPVKHKKNGHSGYGKHGQKRAQDWPQQAQVWRGGW